MKIFSSKRLKIYIVGLLFLITTIIGVSYSFYSANVKKIQETETVLTAEELGLIYTGVTEISAPNMVPGDSFKKTFTVENTSDVAVDFNIYMENITNEFGQDLVYILSDDKGTVIEERLVPKTKEGKSYLKTTINIEAKELRKYTMQIEYKYLEDVDQSNNLGASFKGTIGIDTEKGAVEELEKNVKIIAISNAVRGKEKNELVGYQEYVGDFIKIGDETLKQLNLNWTGEYYVNIKTGEIYDCTPEAEKLNGVTYRTIQEYNQIVKSHEIKETQNLIELKNKQFEEINNLQYDSGAYATYGKSTTNPAKSVPYFNSIGLLGLMNDIPSLKNIKKYIQWHFMHINSEDIAGNIGTIYDYSIGINGEETIYDQETLYDSIDSYASLFFILLDEYYNKTGDKSIFEEYKEELKKAEEALNSMFDYENNGTNLTLTKTQYKVYYLMDNCESYAAYQSLAAIYKNIYLDNEKSNLYQERAQLIKDTINQKLWNESHPNREFHFYDYALLNSSYSGLLIDRTYYPYVLGQLYPVLYNVVDSDTEKAQHLYFLHQYYSDWSKDGKNLWYTFNHNDDTYPHFESLLASLMYKNSQFSTRVTNYTINVEYEIKQAISKIYNDYKSNNYGYWTTAERGYIIRALNMYMER